MSGEITSPCAQQGHSNCSTCNGSEDPPSASHTAVPVASQGLSLLPCPIVYNGNGSNHMHPSPASSSSSADSGFESTNPSAAGINSVIGRDANYSCNGFTVTLLEADLWNAFNTVGNEMIVTKPGRRLFPSLLVSLSGLEHDTEYNIYLKITPADKYRYKFLDMRWVAVSESHIRQDTNRQIYQHPNSPKTGEFWMKKPISFKPCKITHNNEPSTQANILLHTMHKYVLAISVTPVHSPNNITTIPLTATQFISVSSYQNTALTQLKIENNPFAKGFRDRHSDILSPVTHPLFSHTYSRQLAWENGSPQPLPDISRMIESTPSVSVPLTPISFHAPAFGISSITTDRHMPQQLPQLDGARPYQLAYPRAPLAFPPPLMSMPKESDDEDEEDKDDDDDDEDNREPNKNLP